MVATTTSLRRHLVQGGLKVTDRRDRRIVVDLISESEIKVI